MSTFNKRLVRGARRSGQKAERSTERAGPQSLTADVVLGKE